jgi:DNA topoisomerase-1
VRGTPGQHLLQYLGEDGAPARIDPDDVNAYLGEITADDFTAKDFRTWTGTVLAAWALEDPVSRELGNTRRYAAAATSTPTSLDTHLEGTVRSVLEREARRKLSKRSRG